MSTLKKLITIASFTGLIAAVSTVAFADVAQQPSSASSQKMNKHQPENIKQQLRKDLTSPLGGAISPTTTLTPSWQQSVGGMSGNTNGLNGYPTASGQPSSYPGNKH